MSKRDDAIIKAFNDYSEGVGKCIQMGSPYAGILHFSYHISSTIALRQALKMPVEQTEERYPVTITLKSHMTDTEYARSAVEALMAAAKDAGFSIEKA